MNSAIQFHATSEELLALCEWIGREVTGRIVCTQFPPQRRFEVPVDGLREAFRNPKSLGFAFVIGRSIPGYDGEPSNAIKLQLERRKRGQLRQSTIGISSSNKATEAAWKVVRGHVKKMTVTGAVATNPESQDSVRMPSFRFTEGARRLSEAGVVMLPSAGGTVITFES